MTLDNFTPTVWAGTMLRYLDKIQIAAGPQIVNRDYEGDISAFGDTVKINQVGPVTIGSYTKDTDIAAPETLTSAQTTLVINVADYFNFEVDSIDAAQNNPKVMQTAMSRAAYAQSDKIDAALITAMTAGVASGNIFTADTSMSSTDAYDHLVDLAVLLSTANVPTEGRWAIIPPWYHGLILKDSRWTASPPLSANVLQNGMVNRIAGMDIYVSRNVVEPSAGATYAILAGVNAATSFARQVVDVIAYQPEKRFADAVKGLTVYGMKVVLPNALAKIVCTK